MKKICTILISGGILVLLIGFLIYDNNDEIKKFIELKINKPIISQDFKNQKIGDINLISEGSSELKDNSPVSLPFTTSTCDWEYTINKIEITKEQPSNIVIDNDSKINSSNRIEFINDKLADKYFYLIVNITIKNMLSEKREYLMNSIQFLPLDQDMFRKGYYGELRGFSHTYMESLKRFHYEFKPNETLNADLVYILSKDEIDKYDGYLDIDNTGKSGFTEDERLIKIYFKK